VPDRRIFHSTGASDSGIGAGVEGDQEELTTAQLSGCPRLLRFVGAGVGGAVAPVLVII